MLAGMCQDEQSPAGAATVYQIKVKGQLTPEWASWFDGLTVAPDENGDTLLTGPLLDQAALYGVLKKVRDLGLPLLALNCLEPPETAPGE
jgi:hypothetical protein